MEKLEKENQTKNDLMTLQEVCELLHLKRSTLYSWNTKRLLPYIKLRNRLVFYRREDILNFVNSDVHKIRSKQQIQDAAISNILHGK